MNKAVLVGRLVERPELRYTNSNVPVSKFRLAVNRTFVKENGEREADFINCIAWRNQAENLCKYMGKGSQIAVEGRIQTGSYDADDGTKRYTTDIICENIQFLESKQSSNTQKESSPYDFHNKEKTTVEEDPFADFGDSVVIDDNFLD